MKSEPAWKFKMLFRGDPARESRKGGMIREKKIKPVKSKAGSWGVFHWYRLTYAKPLVLFIALQKID